MDKASGVYLTVTDNSIESNIGTAGLQVLVPMITLKGKLGLNTVDATNFKDILGYDVEKNSNYYGLQRILESVPYAKVWRLNQGATIANAVFTGTQSSKSTKTGIETLDELKEDTTDIIVIANKEVGDWQTSAVKFTPVETVRSVVNTNPTEDATQTIEIDDTTNLSTGEKMTIGGTEVSRACVFYDGNDSEIIGCVTGGKVYKVVDGKVLTEDAEGEDLSVGTATQSGKKLTIALSSQLNGDSTFYIHSLPSELKEWTLTLARSDNGVYSVQKEYALSVDENSEHYWKNADFGDLYVHFKNNDWRGMTSIRDYFTLESGTNGASEINVVDIDTSVLDGCDCNILVTNGMTDYRFVNRIAPKCASSKIHIFCDAPSYARFEDVNDWAKKIYRSEYVAIGARPDRFEYNGKEMFIYPSVNYVVILANMLNTNGSLNFPPAGFSYGAISASDLIECDYERYGDELKTGRINWQKVSNRGTVMWEQRTTYALDSDLSYIAPVFILDELCANLKSFEENFNFRYMTPDDIINQNVGLKSILDSYVNRNFLYDYKLKVPSFAEAQASGRNVDIKIEVRITKDAEVININVRLSK